MISDVNDNDSPDFSSTIAPTTIAPARSTDDAMLAAIFNMQTAILNMQGLQATLVSGQKAVQELCNEIKDMRSGKESESVSEQDEVREDWMLAARVVDRICLIIFFFSLCVGTLYFVINSTESSTIQAPLFETN